MRHPLHRAVSCPRAFPLASVWYQCYVVQSAAKSTVQGVTPSYGQREGVVMDFYDVLERVLEILQQHKRVTYRALQRQFDLDEAYLEDLKAEIIEARQLAVDEGGRVLVWTGAVGIAPALALPLPQAA